MPKDYWEDISDEAKKIAPEMEKLMQGLSVSDAKLLLHRLAQKIEAVTKIGVPTFSE